MTRLAKARYDLFSRKVTIYPLVTFRLLFGLLLLVSIVRFTLNGWITSLYVEPVFFFTYYGFEWVKPLEETGMYLVFFLMGISAVGMMLGYFYRVSAALFFLLFTYTELIDKANYLNHYYFVSIVSFLMIWMPAHRYFSLDVKRKAVQPVREVPVLFQNCLRLQLGLVYFFAGLAKVNYDWLFRAQPLTLWLSAQVHKPVIGWLFRYKLTAYLFSWGGMIFDLTIPFLLSIRRLLPWAYLLVVFFHLITWWLFPIGMFPFIMMVATTLFFPSALHEKFILGLERVLKVAVDDKNQTDFSLNPLMGKLLIVFFAFQFFMPLRYMLYPGHLFWTEEGYRFSWRVMLMEKAGQATFHIYDSENSRHVVAGNYEYLTPQQEKMMATQPDMILQFARFLREEYQSKGFKNPRVTVDTYVSLNGLPGKKMVDPEVNLAEMEDSWAPKDWILTYE